VQGCARTSGALDGDGAAEGRDAVSQPNQAGATDGVGAPDAVVTYTKVKDSVGRFGVHQYGRGVRVLGGISEGLGDDVIRGDFDSLR
jgi:hypothetical protein